VTIFHEFENELHALAGRSSAAEPVSRARRGPRVVRLNGASDAIPFAVSVAVVIAVVATVLAFSGRDRSPTAGQPATPLALNANTSALAVLQRAQTKEDRTLPAVAGRAARLGGRRGSGLSSQTVESFLRGAIPRSMRYAQTLPDGREVFLTRVRDPTVHQPLLGLWIVAPDGSWRHGQPVLHTTVGLPDNRIARIQALAGPSCEVNSGPTGVHSGVTDWSIVPDGVSRVRWQFPREGVGRGDRGPLTLDVPVHGNTAVATIPGRTLCDPPRVVALYAASGQVIARAALPPSATG
jgi:hypothetical protein